MFSNVFFFLKNLAVREILSKKFGGAREATDGNMVARCMLD
jgi:hypothetical protein